MLKRLLPVRLWYMGLGLVALLGVAVYFVSARPVTLMETDQALRQEQTVARAEASNLASFFQVFGNSVAVLAQFDSMRSRDSSTQNDLDTLIGQWGKSGLVSTVVLTNQSGTVIFSSDVSGTEDVGMNLSDRDWFAWAKNSGNVGKYLVGQAVVGKVASAKGQVIAPVASPVYEKGVFMGVVAAAVEVEPLTARYLNMMKVSDQTDVYLIGSSGDLLYSTSTGVGAPGSNIFITQDNPFLGSSSLNSDIKNSLDKGTEGTLTLNGSSIAYSPVPMGNRNWLLVMVSPIQNITGITTPTHIRQISSLVLIGLTILLFGIFVARESQVKIGTDLKTSEKESPRPQNKL